MSRFTETNCRYCNAVLKRQTHHVLTSKLGSFCDRKTCYAKFREKNLSGTNNLAFKNGSAKQGRYIKVYVPWHPKAVSNYRQLHRLLMEFKLGRVLREDEVVHHKDNNPANNHWDNLELMSKSEHSKHHAPEMDKGRKNAKRI